jgi:hypothetical protein
MTVPPRLLDIKSIEHHFNAYGPIAPAITDNVINVMMTANTMQVTVVPINSIAYFINIYPFCQIRNQDRSNIRMLYLFQPCYVQSLLV